MEERKYKIPDEEVYSKEELAFFKDVEDNLLAGKYNTPVKELEEKKKMYSKIAKNTLEKLSKKKQYSIRLMENDVDKIKSMATHKGLSYQSYISSILHQVATKQIKM
ncbi:hypothetical protein BHECKSOX2_54 [Bathymodiolus heckerae thiotrophic gill symbiont]|uniref:hypothetical protein n=1 Tax=Bathymodiolus heckerae thiotrophic gill symbiont TaxID=1052212 RepID=UPI0010B3C5FA|nr:hypothetical protein [Bathymodiolus heckerae thiotrophic gill symbiont]CAC9457533.1 hypothetical protein [uncultured Gammaproteobacteria bacterium]SMN14181.1 hypothetical protein BHECKSOX2_54 [Bathymodiolus heckerae thiotrophic gill symbiont]